MPLRFRRYFKVLPGLRINLGKRSVSASIGGRGARFTAGTRGSRTTIGIPGTGISATQVHASSRKKAGLSLLRLLFWLIVICVVVYAFLGRSANAQERYGPWAFFTSRTSQNTPVCGIASTSRGGTIQNIGIKMLAGHETLNVTVYKDSWTIPQGTQVPVGIDFMDNDVLKLSGYGDGKVVDIEIPKEGFALLLSAVGASPAIRIRFLKGNEPTMQVPLAGVKPELQKLLTCIKAQSRTQPF